MKGTHWARIVSRPRLTAKAAMNSLQCNPNHIVLIHVRVHTLLGAYGVDMNAIISNAAYDDMRQLLNRQKYRQTYPCNLLLFCR